MINRLQTHYPTNTTLLLDNLGFPEGPRWRDNRLWFSDFLTRKVTTVDLEGHVEEIARVAGQPSGLGWLPDGSLLIVSMVDRKLLRLCNNKLSVVAELGRLASYHCNDMVVDAKGRAYIGNFGSELYRPYYKTAEIILVRPNGDATVVADKMAFPNGSVITPDGCTLIVAETLAARLTAFDIEPDGALSNRRIWAEFDTLGIVTDTQTNMNRVLPDGICLDAENCIWVASPNRRREVLRVCEGGDITCRFELTHTPYACMLGGQHGKSLFLMTCENVGRIEMIEVDVPGAKSPQ